MQKLTERTFFLGFLANLCKDEPKWGDDAAKVTKSTSKGSKSEPTGAKGEANGDKREPKVAKSEPDGDPNGIKNRSRSDVRKRSPKSLPNDLPNLSFWEPKNIKNPSKKRCKNRCRKKVMKNDEHMMPKAIDLGSKFDIQGDRMQKRKRFAS